MIKFTQSKCGFCDRTFAQEVEFLVSMMTENDLLTDS
jgi:hypothetical protein